MKTTTITRADLTNGEYTAKAEFDGHVEIEANLGWVRFPRALTAKGRVRASAGSGISAGWGISAGSGISAGWGISAGSGISAGWGISAGEGISAGWGISAGEGISAGSGISAKLVLKFTKRLFAGIAVRFGEDDAPKTVECGKLEGGTVVYGDVQETGLPAPDESLAEARTKLEGVRDLCAAWAPQHDGAREADGLIGEALEKLSA
jgi:hypothetical protein